MANIQTWNGTATFSAGMTPFGFYDSDTEFQADIIKVAKFCGQRLGYPLMDVELQALLQITTLQHAPCTQKSKTVIKRHNALPHISGNPCHAGQLNKSRQPRKMKNISLARADMPFRT